ncbi:MAG: DUF502 domain-containing protein, partial [Nitrospinales bacterium]
MKQALKKNFIAGLLVTIPVGLTYFLLSFIIKRVDKSFSPWITDLLRHVGVALPENFHIPGLGFVVIFLVIFLVGLLATNFIGRRVVALGDWLIHKMPVVRSIYQTIKKMVEIVTGPDFNAFNQVVLVEYPRPGLRGLGIVCSDTSGEIIQRLEDDLVNVFVPTAPNPTTGFLLALPRQSIIPLKMSVEDGIKMVLSLGIVVPLWPERP